MKLPEFQKITQDKTSTPPWTHLMEEGQFISYGPTFQSKIYFDLFDEYVYPSKETGDIRYYVYDPVKHGMPEDKTYPVLMWLHGMNNALDGIKCIFCCGAEQYASPKYQEAMGGAYIIVPLANEERLPDMSIKGAWNTFKNDSEDSIYSDALKGIYDKVCDEHKENVEKRFVMGASSGGYMTWQMLKHYPDYFAGAIPISAGYLPDEEMLNQLEQTKTQVIVAHGKLDELAPFEYAIEPNREKYESMKNVICYFPQWVQNGDKGISSICYGFEMGQHCMINQIQANLMFDDGNAMDERFPNGITGWIRSVCDK